jgi:ABC-type sugar transport system permease subunit
MVIADGDTIAILLFNKFRFRSVLRTVEFLAIQIHGVCANLLTERCLVHIRGFHTT